MKKLILFILVIACCNWLYADLKILSNGWIKIENNIWRYDKIVRIGFANRSIYTPYSQSHPYAIYFINNDIAYLTKKDYEEIKKYMETHK